MPAGQLFIKSASDTEYKDAYTVYGISFDSSALSTLMTPSPMKEYVTSKSRLRHGTTYADTNPKVNEREMSLTFNISASTEDEFIGKYWKFCALLEKGSLDIKHSALKDKVFHLKYKDCSQFTEYYLGIANFTLRVVEHNPMNRQ